MKILTVKKSSEFQAIGRDCAKFHAKGLLLLEKKSPQKYLLDKERGLNAQDFCRLGLTVSKKVGNAVMRNLVKRRLRHAFREICKENLAKNQHDYVIIAKKEIKDVDFVQILKDLRFCITRIGKVKP